ncbi:disulfide bond formation protein B [Candidatus Parcubacteria bacterium]|nr:disulfide bond formation protein B [Candidatus Parcubacteria bacterium]
MIQTIAWLMPFLVLGFHLFLVVAVFALIFRKSWGRSLVHWVGKHAITLGLLLSVIAVGGSLFYSNGVGFEPCYLCWWQRIALYPLLVLFLTALKDKDRGVFKYTMRLSVIALILALYHSYVQWGGNPLIPCSATASCAKLYVYAFHYITIPTMSLTIAVSVILLWLANRLYQRS